MLALGLRFSLFCFGILFLLVDDLTIPLSCVMMFSFFYFLFDLSLLSTYIRCGCLARRGLHCI